MFRRSPLSALLAGASLLAAPLVAALGSQCDAPLTTGLAAPGDPYWLQNIKHQGTSAFNPNSTYQVFRNVMDYGAKGDGVTDDTVAINAAMSAGYRCGYGCPSGSSTLTPALIYFPPGVYQVSRPITTYYYTEMIGDARTPPTLLASANFTGLAVIDADPYAAGGVNWFVNQNNFYRSIRNLVIDTRQMPPTAPATGIHWQVSQATSLVNVVVEMSQANGTQHRGLFMENGSGGFMGDLVFNGGKTGIAVGNQQFTVRNLTVNNAGTAVSAAWSWGWTYQGVSIRNCTVGFSLTTGGTTSSTQSVGSEAIVDASVVDTHVFVQTSKRSNGTLAGSIVLNNINLNNVPVAVGVLNGTTVLEGSTDSMYIDTWAQGNLFVGSEDKPHFTQGYIQPPQRPWSTLDPNGNIFGRGHPQYADYSLSQIVSVKSYGAKGDGYTDDTKALQNIFDMFAGCKLIFFDAGTYYVTDTLNIPAGTQMTGEAWSVIMGGGANFQDEQNPKVVVQVGEPWSNGIMEISDIVFTTRGPAPGAIVVEWNVHEPWFQQGGAGMWDSYVRIGGTAGTMLQYPQCPTSSLSPDCKAAFLGLHLTQGSSAYLEGTWVWTADHDMDDPKGRQINIFSGRGGLSESFGPVWMIGTVEHNSLYQYNFHGAANHWIGFAQTETPYYQPIPPATQPFTPNPDWHDPTWYNATSPMAWAFYVQESWDIILMGGGFYSFFQNYTQGCLANYTCQASILGVDEISTFSPYSVSTVGTTWQLTVGEEGVINQAYGHDGFQQTFTAWTRW